MGFFRRVFWVGYLLPTLPPRRRCPRGGRPRSALPVGRARGGSRTGPRIWLGFPCRWIRGGTSSLEVVSTHSVVDPNPVECETFSRIRVLEKMRPDPSSSGKLVKFVTISQQNAQFKEINYRIFCQKNIPLKAYISY